MNALTKLIAIGGLAVFVGCAQRDTIPNAASSSNSANSEYLASAEPANAVPVGTVRTEATDGDSVVAIGHIGGSTEPFVDGLAAFTIVDPSIPYCPPEEGCPTPWDYCCTQNEVKSNIATVKIVNEQGKPIADDARRLLGVKELSLVVVEGTAQLDPQGNLSILANKVFVKQ